MNTNLSSKTVLSSKWWQKNLPSSLNKLQKARLFIKTLVEYEEAQIAHDKAETPSDIEDARTALERILDDIEKNAKSFVKEAEPIANKLPDKARDKDQAELVCARLASPLREALKKARKGVSVSTLPEVEEDQTSPEATPDEINAQHLARVLPRLKKGPFAFALAVPNGKADNLTMLFHREKEPKVLLARVRKDVGGGKGTYGRAVAESVLQSLPGAEHLKNGTANTLVLQLDGPVLPGLRKQVRNMLVAKEISTFTKVRILTSNMEDVGDILEDSFNKMKAKMEPLIRGAMTRYPEQRDAFARLFFAMTKAERIGRYDLGIAILRDKVAPLLKSSSRFASRDKGNEDLHVVAPQQPEAVQPRRNRFRLGRLFQKLFAGLRSRGNASSGSDEKPWDIGSRAPLLQEWTNNMAVLQDLSGKVEPGSPEHKALMNRQLSYLLKFADIEDVRPLNWQTNPIQLQIQGGYHREGFSDLTKRVTSAAADKLGVPKENTFLVSDRRVLEAVGRVFASEGEGETVHEWSDEDYDRVLRRALAGEDVFVDATAAFQAEGKVKDGPIAKGVAASVMVKLKQRAFANALSLAGMSKKEFEQLGINPLRSGDMSTKSETQLAKENALRDSIVKDYYLAVDKLHNVTLGGVMAVGEQHALTVMPFTDTAKVGKAGASMDWVAPHPSKIRGLLASHGFTAGPLQLLDCWLSQTPDVKKILDGLGMKGLPEPNAPDYSALAPIDDFEKDFLDQEEVKAFAALADDDMEETPPYLYVNTNAMMALVQGLELVATGANPHGCSVKSSLEEKGLGELWSTSLHRIKALMKEAVACKKSMREFLNKVALIQEEVATLIAVAKPYDKDDFQNGMLEVTKFLPEDFAGEKISVDFSLKNSASRCFDAVLTACEDTKEQAEGEAGHLAKRGLEVLVQADSYYEPSQYVLDHSKGHRQTTLSPNGSDTPSASAGETVKTLDAQIADLKAAQDKGERAKLDTYLCEFHHNISLDKKEYNIENVTGQVRKLIEGGVVANPFTVSIDTTIGRTDEEAVKVFLKTFQTEIGEGRMNVVIFRSAQKFDQFGGDMYNGGVMCVVSANTNDKPTPFQRALDSEGEAVAEENFQGLTHLNLSAQETLNDYRDAIAWNTQLISNPDSGSVAALPPEMLYTPENADKSMLQIAVNTDEMAPFIDIKLPYFKEGDELKEAAGQNEPLAEIYRQVFWVLAEQLPDDPENAIITTRASFGFQNTNVTKIGDFKLRLNPGLEDEQRLATHTQTLKDINELMMTLKEDLSGEPDLRDTAVTDLLMLGSLISIPTIAALRAFRQVNTNPSATQEEKDQARLQMARALSGKKGLGISPNPLRVLRLIDEMSPDFRETNKDELAFLREDAEMTLANLKESTSMLLLIEQEKKKDNYVMVARLLSQLENYDAGTPEHARAEVVRRWHDEIRAALGEELEQSLGQAETAYQENDARVVKQVLDYEFPAEYMKVRGGDVTFLREWADAVYEENRKQAEQLLEQIQMCIDYGTYMAAPRYKEQLEKMLEADLPGVSKDAVTLRLQGLKAKLSALSGL